VGAGLSGLSAAIYLENKGFKTAIYEASSRIGGRCKTEYLDGFILDRGLHFFQKAFPESKRLLDFRSLRLENLYPGVMVHYQNEFHLVTNPLKRFGDLLSNVIAPISTLRDKFKMVGLLTQVSTYPDKFIFNMEEKSVKDFLEEKGFSQLFIQSFFKPFVKTVFYDSPENVSTRLFCYMLKVFSTEENTLPANGISSIPHQLAAQLSKDCIHLHTKVTGIHEDGLTLSNGEIVHARKVILAIPPHKIEKILPGYVSDVKFLPVSCLYFASKTAPVNQPIILLNGEEDGLVNSVFVPTTLQPSYAPAGSHLIAVTLKNHPDMTEDELIDAVLQEMVGWFGVKVNEWAHLKTFHIQNALPQKKKMNQFQYTQYAGENVFICGDHLSFGSINSALLSGRETAEAVEKSLKTGIWDTFRKKVLSS
jgi:phytoene dehydrogenase-like protein